MWALLLEAGVAMLLLVGIVWWTMFAGPKPPARPLRAPPPANPSGAEAEHSQEKPPQ